MKKTILFLLILALVFTIGCDEQTTTKGPIISAPLPDESAEEPIEEPEITNFEECIAADNPAMESYPRQCRADDETFTEEIDEPICEDMCGDGECPDYVCQGTGCPCSEDENSCPEDCAVKEPFCGDGTCGKGEQCNDCEEDCGCTVDEACYENECKLIVCGRDYECDDDDDCTRDVCQFPEHPNSFCDYKNIDTCKSGDGCCPADCNAENDNDCDPVCGNDICEEDENEDCEEDCEDDEPECGNGDCEDGEDYDSCPEDCV